MSQGELAVDVCASLGIDRHTPYDWCRDDPAFDAMYARARELQAHAFSEQLVKAAYGLDDYAQAVALVLACEERRIDELPDRERNAAYAMLNSLRNAAVQRDRLRVDALKWTTSKLFPRVYGDKQAVEHTGAVGSYVVEVPATEPDAATWAANAKPKR
jgi:hypothetical protein